MQLLNQLCNCEEKYFLNLMTGTLVYGIFFNLRCKAHQLQFNVQVYILLVTLNLQIFYSVMYI